MQPPKERYCRTELPGHQSAGSQLLWSCDLLDSAGAPSLYFYYFFLFPSFVFFLLFFFILCFPSPFSSLLSLFFFYFAVSSSFFKTLKPKERDRVCKDSRRVEANRRIWGRSERL
jgi:hypothetical protein